MELLDAGDVFRNYVIQLGYQGTKGTHLDVLQSPNRAPLGGSSLTTQQRLQIPNASHVHIRHLGG